MDWRREAAGEARVERGSGAACGDPRRRPDSLAAVPAAVHWVRGSLGRSGQKGAATPAVEGQHLGNG